MKELEALKRLRNGYDDKYYKQFTSSAEMQDIDYNIVLKALTPPTQEEVCKALSEYLKEEVIYNERWGFMTKNSMRVIICKWHNGKIKFNDDYHVHIYELIGRFYQGVKE